MPIRYSLVLGTTLLVCCALDAGADSRRPTATPDPQCGLFQGPVWKQVICDITRPEFRLRWKGSKNSLRVTCEKRETISKTYWDYAKATCFAVGSVGYFLKRNDGKFRCCGSSPLGETCQDKLVCPRGFSKDQSATSPSHTCRRKSTKAEQRGVYFVPGWNTPPFTTEPEPVIRNIYCGALADQYLTSGPPKQKFTSANPRWFAPRCRAGFTLQSRVVNNTLQVTCEKRETKREPYWTYKKATCARVGNVGYFLASSAKSVGHWWRRQFPKCMI